jgi:threonylcarbamoyladenosine tRNA methylthiotransferase MtaB
VFPFSARPGTEAEAMRPAVPERLRRERAQEIGALSRGLAAAYAQRWVGREVDVLLEAGRARPAERARVHGVSENYLKVDVHGIPDGEAVVGRLVRVRITAAGPVMSGRIATFTP